MRQTVTRLPSSGYALVAVPDSSASTCAHFPRQITESGSFANKLNAEQYAKQPDRCYWKAGPEIHGYQYSNDPAGKDPTPIRKRPYRQRKNYLRNTLDHKVHEQEKCEHEKSFPPMANQKHTDLHRQDDRDKLKPEMGHVARVEKRLMPCTTPADDQEPAQK